MTNRLKKVWTVDYQELNISLRENQNKGCYWDIVTKPLQMSKIFRTFLLSLLW